MSYRRIRPAVCLFLLILLAFVFAGCNLGFGASRDRPQSGSWRTEFTTETGGGDEKHWIIVFTVSEDGKTASGMQVAYYIGELTSSTNVTVIFPSGEEKIKNNSFEFSLSDYSGYSSNTYDCKVKFNSKDTATGTIDIGGAKYEWTAAPISDTASASSAVPAKAVRSAADIPVSFAAAFYQFSRIMAILLGIAIFILIIRSELTSGLGTVAVIGIPAVLSLLAMGPLLAFQDEQNALLLAWAFYILLAVKVVICACALRFELGFLWAARKSILLLFCLLCLISAAWSARSVELIACLFSDTRNVLLKLVVVVAGVLYTAVYFVLDFGALIFLTDMVGKNVGADGIAFVESNLATGDAGTRMRVLDKLNKISEEWAWRLLVRQSSADPDANLRGTARKMAAEKNLPPELRAELEAVVAAEPVAAPFAAAVESAPFDPPRETANADAPPQEAVADAGHAEQPRARFCTSCGKPLEGNPNFCAQCGSKIPESHPGKSPSTAPEKVFGALPGLSEVLSRWKTQARTGTASGLNGFAKGWVIFILIIASLLCLSTLTTLYFYFYNQMIGVVLLNLLLRGCTIAGPALMLAKRPYGFWVLFAGVLIMTLSNAVLPGGNFTVFSLLWPTLTFLTWLFTRQQLDYRFWKKQITAAPLSGNPEADRNIQMEETVMPQSPYPPQAADRQSFAGEQNAVQPIVYNNTPPRAKYRGGLGEPYCSQACYEQSGEYISSVMLQNQEGVCGFCQKPVRTSMYGAPECAAIPFEGITLFICTDCMDQVNLHVRNHPRCCMCRNAIEPDITPR